MLKTVLYLSVPVLAFSFTVGALSFMVTLDARGVRKWLRRGAISWGDVESVRITGFRGTNYFNKIRFSGEENVVEVEMFIFDNQKTFIQEVKQYLPWAMSLELEQLPVEVRKY